MKHTNKTKTILGVLLVAALTIGSLWAYAADPEPAAPEKAGEASSADPAVTTGRAAVQDLDVNKAELAAGGELEFRPDAAGPALKPMTIEINAVLEDARLQVATLQEQFDREPNAEAALAIARRIEEIKVNTELDILRVQARHARAAGNEDLARQIDAAVTEMTTPRPVRQPIERPATDAGNR